MGTTTSAEKKVYIVYPKEKLALFSPSDVYHVESKLSIIHSSIRIPVDKLHTKYHLGDELDFSKENINGFIYGIQGSMDKIKLYPEKLGEEYGDYFMGYQLKSIPKSSPSIQKVFVGEEMIRKKLIENSNKTIKKYFGKKIAKGAKYVVLLREKEEKYEPLLGYDVAHAYSEDWQDKINDMEGTIHPCKSLEMIKRKYSNYSFVHATDYAKETIFNGNLCIYGDCTTKYYDEKTGKYLFPKKKRANVDDGGVPGIYMELFEYGTTPPMSMSDEFIFSSIDTFYGEIGFIFPFPSIFKYHTDLKKDQAYGMTENISIERYINNRKGGEAIARANKISIKDSSAIFVMFNNFERIYISDKLFTRKKNPTLRSVINLYRKNPDNKWYIRKSNLRKILEIYDRFNIKIPPMYCFALSREWYVEHDIFESPLDINSDDDV